MSDRLKIIERNLTRAEGWFMVALLSIMVGLTVVQVLLRNLQTRGEVQLAASILGRVDWAEPLVRLSVLWLTFFGASVVTGQNRHIKMDMVSGVLPPAWLPFRELLLNIASAVICALMFHASLSYVDVEFRSGSVLFLGIPSWVAHMILPLGFFLILLKFLVRTIEELRSVRRGRT
jgi:TRAP-type C4-dicarboxylate transport system permease small subunit